MKIAPQAESSELSTCVDETPQSTEFRASPSGAFQWVSSRTLQFTPQGRYNLTFPYENPVMLHCVHFSQDYRLTPNQHDHLEIAYIYEGLGEFSVENRTYPVEAGDAVIVGQGEFHLLRARQTNVKVISLYFTPEFIHQPGGSALDFHFLRPFFYRSSDFSHRLSAADLEGQPMMDRLRKIHEETLQRPADWGLAVKTYLLDILLIVARYYSSKRIGLDTPSRSIDDYERLRKVISFLTQHYHEHISLDEVARIACLSPTAFCRLFKRVTGNTLSDFVLRLRTDRAMDLLCESNKSITEIALEVGFGSHSHFARVFLKFTGVSPLRFRRQGGAQFR